LRYKLNKKIQKEVSGSFISYSWPALFSSLILILPYWIDSMAIGFFKSVKEVGLYNAIIPITLLLNITPEIFLRLFFPMVTKEYASKNLKFIKSISQKIGKWIFMINLPIFFLIILFSDTIILILFGPDYTLASNSLKFLIIGVFFSSIFTISNNLLSMAGKSKILLYDVIITSIISVILNLVLIPLPYVFGIDNSLGIMGAAVATTISFLVFNLLVIIQVNYYVSVNPLRKDMISIFISALISLLIAFSLNKILEPSVFSFVIITLTFFLVYVLLLFLSKSFDKEEVMIFTFFKRRLIHTVY
ncbi:MAG: polysaccharide biosynthesis C-terminal domain-containing protein, partial [Nanoarchaeota archaeon]